MLGAQRLLSLSLLLILSACTSQGRFSEAHQSDISPNQATNTAVSQITQTSEQQPPTQPPATDTRTPTATPTHRPTRTPFPTPAPLAAEAVASCPVSLPHHSSAPNPIYNWGNPEATMSIQLWPGGKVIFHPDGPGHVGRDGSLTMKFWFDRTIPGEVVIEGQRLDEPGPTALLDTLRGPMDGYGETGFHPSALRFPGQGCWEVTARLGDSRMTFVTLVVWIPFKPLWAGSLPDGFIEDDTDLAGYPNTIEYVFRYADGGEVRIGTQQGVWDESYPDSAQRSVTIGVLTATCVQGNWDGQQWNIDADATTLLWSDQGLSYRIRQSRLGLRCQDLRRMAGS